MDNKGSLVDTNLRIYPTEKLITYIKSITAIDGVPHNIQEIIKGEKQNFKSYGRENIKISHLTSEEIKNLKKISDELGPITDEVLNDYKNFEGKELINTQKVEENDCRKGDKANEEINNGKESKDTDSKNKDTEVKHDKIFLVTADIDWLYEHLYARRNKGDKDIPYLHTLLENTQIDVPDNEIMKRNPILEARCVKLRAQQEAREYRKMTKGVDNVRMRFPEDSISYQMKQLNRQLIAIGQFIISIFAGFLFGFRGVEWMVGNLDFGFRLLLGVMCALVIALAEIYFLAKKLNEELNVPETVQLGGPLKFADQKNYPSEKSTVQKHHQD